MARQTSQATLEQSSVSGSLMKSLMGMKDDIIKEVSGIIDNQSSKISELYEKLNTHVGSFKV